MTQSVRMSTLLIRRLKGVFAAALVLSVPAFAVSALTSSAGTPAVAIAAEDNAFACNLATVKAPAMQTVPAAVHNQDGAAVQLQNWVYTGKPNPSPGH
jgi:hypothetical protein